MSRRRRFFGIWRLDFSQTGAVAAGLAKADPVTREKIRAEVLRIAEGHLSGGTLRLACGTHVVSGIK